VTFPQEARFKDVDYAKKVYEKVVKRTLDLGVSSWAEDFRLAFEENDC